MRVWLLSDTHCQHDKLLIPDGIDMVVHAGDATNSRSPVVNNNEMLKFLEWYEALNIQYKVYVPGNHDTSIEHAYISKDMFLSRGIHLLIDRYLFIRSEDHANMKMLDILLYMDPHILQDLKQDGHIMKIENQCIDIMQI